ncbi:MAG TPA: hypothetical protein VGH34_07795 [Vicinamibacterales bacterium]
MRQLRMWVGGALIAGAMALLTSCGGDSTSTGNGTAPSTGCTPSSNAATFVLMNNTICPTTLTVTRGTQITISNQDSRVHEMDSDPHPEHTDCPEINAIDFLNPGQSRQSSNLNIARTCGFHDHQNPDNAALKGKVVIQ